ncbi:hypothetical protein AAFN47_18385 [Hoeflea sp. CAU 1731]
MSRAVCTSLMVLSVVAATPSLAQSIVAEADSFESFSSAFCSASHEAAHIFVVPAAIFSEHSEVTCDNGVSGLRSSEPEDDPGHTVFNIDPPSGAPTALDCDGKADTGMETIAINCIPADMESVDHKKT